MRPLRLEVSGFMPFKDQQTLEFADLTLFAICGPTGSGKSTILDAIVYGLYGQTPRLGKRGMSELINPNTDKLSVSFDFEVRGNFYRVVRVLTRRKSGLELRLYQQDENADWKQVPEIGTKEVNYKLTQVIGLNYDDFIRAVLLPQGAFDSFLRGKAQERRDLLIKLLSLERIPRVMQLANEKSKSAEEKLSFIEKELERFSSIAQAAIENLQEEKLKLKEQEKNLKKELAEQAKILAELEKLKELFDERNDASKSLLALESQSSAIEEKRKRLKLAKQAEPLIKPLADFEQLQTQLTNLVAEINKLLPKLKEQKEITDSARATLTETKEKRDKRVPEIDSQLESLASVSSELKQLKALGGEMTLAKHAVPEVTYSAEVWQNQQMQLRQLEKLGDTRGQLKKLKKNTEKSLKTLQKNLESALRTTQKAGEARLSQIKQGLEKTKQELASSKTEFEQTNKNLSELAIRLAELTERGKDFRKSFEVAEKAYTEAEMANRALALRQHLHKGDACPVCEQVIGNLPIAQAEANLKALNEVQNKAKRVLDKAIDDYKDASSQDKVLKEKFRDDKERTKALEEELTAAQKNYSQVEQEVQLELKGAKQKATEELSNAEIESSEQIQELEKVLKDVEKPFASFDSLDEQALQNSLDQKGKLLLADFALVISKKTGGLDPEKAPAKLKREKNSLEKALDAAREHFDEVSNKLNELEQSQVALNVQQESLQKSLAKETDLLDQLLKQAGFESAKEVQTAFLDKDDQESYNEEIEVFDTSKRDFSKRMAELNERIAGRDFDKEHYESLNDKKGNFELEREKIIERLGSIENEIKETQDKLKHKLELEGELKTNQEIYETFSQLGQDLKGDNFQKYLVRRIQERLSLRASNILRETSHGRYDLYFQKDEYFVSDAWHGGELRSVKNLSGGETFMASLALALALSETVANNTVLGALFLDEGFGTLDSESLDTVASVLENLSSQGRMVGIISHVNELTERVPDRLKVVKSNEGSQLEWDI